MSNATADDDIKDRAKTTTTGGASRFDGALRHLRICDLSGQLAGAGATRVLAAFGAQVVRIEDPVTKGLWDIVRQLGPAIHDDSSPEGGSGFNNHNVEKLGITIDLRQERGKELLRDLVRSSDAVTENFSAGVMERLGFGYDDLKALKPDIVYVSNSGFGHSGPYGTFRSWGPIVQAVSGLTFASGLPDQQPAGWGFSYMDHTGGYMMAIALLAALFHRTRTGEGQWVDMACMEGAATLNGPALLDHTVNGRTLRRPGSPNSNRHNFPAMAPHGVYPTRETDRWVAIACRDDRDWSRFAALLDDPPADRWGDPDVLDALVAEWTVTRHPRRGGRAPPSARGPGSARAALRGPLRPSGAHRAVGAVADGRAHQARTDPRRRPPGALLAHRLAARSGRAAPRRGQRPRVPRGARPRSGRDRRAARRGGDLMSERSERMTTERPPGSRASMGSGGAAPEQMSERSERMTTERPPGSRASMGSGGAAPEQMSERSEQRIGPLDGVTVVELSHELCAWAGKLLADLGAEVVVVEPPGGSVQRTWGPFLDDVPGPERSLWWWQYNTSKSSVVIDRDDPVGRQQLAGLAQGADIVLAGEPLDRVLRSWATTTG